MVADELAADVEATVTRTCAVLLRGTAGELSRTAHAVLGRLRDHGPQRVTSLAAREAVAQPTMTTLVSRLEQKGYVARSADPGDRRAVSVSITPAGGAVLEDLRARRTALLADRLAALDPADRSALAAALPVLRRLTDPPEDSA